MKSRLNLEIDQATRQRMQQLKTAVDASSVTAVIRTSLHLLEKLVEHQRQGGEVVLRGKDGEEKVIEFFW